MIIRNLLLFIIKVTNGNQPVSLDSKIIQLTDLKPDNDAKINNTSR